MVKTSVNLFVIFSQFDIHATAIIDRCFDADEDFAVDLLKRPAHAFYNVKPWELAAKSNCRSFLASKCVQKYLDNEWYKHTQFCRSNLTFLPFFQVRLYQLSTKSNQFSSKKCITYESLHILFDFIDLLLFVVLSITSDILFFSSIRWKAQKGSWTQSFRSK